MNHATPPAPSPSHSQEWTVRNWKWLVPSVCVMAVAAAFGLVSFILGILKGSEPYAAALARAREAPAVIAALGTPIEERFWVTGTIKWNGKTGSADLVIPIVGPKGEATIHVAASQSGVKWHYERLIVQLEKTNEQIDLSDPPSKPK